MSLWNFIMNKYKNTGAQLLSCMPAWVDREAKILGEPLVSFQRTCASSASRDNTHLQDTKESPQLHSVDIALNA